MKIVTFNIRCVYEYDGINSFPHRAGMILDKIAEAQPDIICFQEATAQNMGVLRKALSPDYTVILNGRDADLSGEGLAVAYRPDTCSLHGLEVFWLSPTPCIAASRFPGQSQYPRICQKLLFKNEKSGTIFQLYNLHLEELSEEVRLQQMKLVLGQSMPKNIPVFLLGDLNTQPDGMVYAFCKEQGLTDVTEHILGSFHDYGRINPIKIDYIWTDFNAVKTVKNVSVWEECTDGIYLSDHYPIEMICQL